jgi:hypothetical protein
MDGAGSSADMPVRCEPLELPLWRSARQAEVLREPLHGLEGKGPEQDMNQLASRQYLDSRTGGARQCSKDERIIFK